MTDKDAATDARYVFTRGDGRQFMYNPRGNSNVWEEMVTHVLCVFPSDGPYNAFRERLLTPTEIRQCAEIVELWEADHVAPWLTADSARALAENTFTLKHLGQSSLVLSSGELADFARAVIREDRKRQENKP